MVVLTRPLRGARISSFYSAQDDQKESTESKSGPSLADLDSAFQLQEYIGLLIRKDPHDVETIVACPGKVEDSEEGGNADKEGKDGVVVDVSCWIYEQLRRLAQDLNHPLITSLQQECSRATCPEMKAGEWLYLCVAHGNDGATEQCCAIDYILHTLDSATALLNSPRAFPSRISIPTPSIRHFSSLARRLGRIFAHAYFHHREAFEAAEAENALYARFLALTSRYDLVPPEFLVHPPKYAAGTGGGAQGKGDSTGEDEGEKGVEEEVEPPRLLGAALNPQPMASPRSPENPTPVVLESPRKLGRNRTDTMVFSEEFGEQLREQMGGSPLRLDDEGDGDGGGLPHVDNLELLASSDEACKPHDSQSQPYALAFSASGSIRNPLPPGVAPTSASLGRNSGASALAAAAAAGEEDQGQGETGGTGGNMRLLDLFNRPNVNVVAEEAVDIGDKLRESDSGAGESRWGGVQGGQDLSLSRHAGRGALEVEQGGGGEIEEEELDPDFGVNANASQEEGTLSSITPESLDVDIATEGLEEDEEDFQAEDDVTGEGDGELGEGEGAVDELEGVPGVSMDGHAEAEITPSGVEEISSSPSLSPQEKKSGTGGEESGSVSPSESAGGTGSNEFVVVDVQEELTEPLKASTEDEVVGAHIQSEEEPGTGEKESGVVKPDEVEAVIDEGKDVIEAGKINEK